MKKAIFTLTAIAFSLMIAGCNDSGKGLDSETETSVSSNTTKKVEDKKEETAANNPVSAIIQPSSSKSVVRVVKTTTSQIALKQLEEKDYFGTIVATVEGYRSSFYADNIYPAIGFGWNFAPTTKATNRRIAQSAGLDSGLTEKLLSVSSEARLSPEQAMNSAHSFEKILIDQSAINFFTPVVWNRLSDNQKAVLQYHFYKTGTAGGSKYLGLKKAVSKYASDKSQANSDEVVSHITYNYKVKQSDGTWKQLTDKRSQLYMGTLWTSPEAYGALIGKGKFAPATLSQFTSVANISKVSVNTSSDKSLEDQIDSQDELVQMKDKAAQEGESMNIEQVIDGKTVPYTVEPIAEKPEVKCLGTTTLCSPVKKVEPKPQVQSLPQPVATPKIEAVPQDPSVPKGCKKIGSGANAAMSCTPEGLAEMTRRNQEAVKNLFK